MVLTKCGDYVKDRSHVVCIIYSLKLLLLSSVSVHNTLEMQMLLSSLYQQRNGGTQLRHGRTSLDHMYLVPHTAADFFSVGLGGRSPSLSRLTRKNREGDGSLAKNVFKKNPSKGKLELAQGRKALSLTVSGLGNNPTALSSWLLRKPEGAQDHIFKLVPRVFAYMYLFTYHYKVSEGVFIT